MTTTISASSIKHDGVAAITFDAAHVVTANAVTMPTADSSNAIANTAFVKAALAEAAGSFGGAGLPTVAPIKFTSSGTYTPSPGTKMQLIIVAAAGGGGSAWASGLPADGGGGTGGKTTTIVSVKVPTPFIVGAGVGPYGGKGGDSTFGSPAIVTAIGGGGGNTNTGGAAQSGDLVFAYDRTVHGGGGGGGGAQGYDVTPGGSAGGWITIYEYK